ncbi:MAG: TRAP transporter large permease [Gammaproteobacteria bacterium]|nr:TRAP transporter large permease [Gammaproteobacteria bacterium]
MEVVGLIAMVLALFVLRQNLVVVLGMTAAYAYLVWGDGAVANIIIDAWDALNREVLLSIPLYILAGSIMSRGTMAQRLIRLMRALTAPIPGGLAIATVLSCAVFAAISGSSVVTLLAVGSVMYPALLQAGYSKSFALGSLCAAGTLGIIVPPSIPLILYGVMTQTSIADLFIAGIGPALLLVLLMSAYAITRNWRLRTGSWSLREIWLSLRHGIWALFMPVLILGGIYSGYFTATESAAVAVVYAIFVELAIHRELGLRGMYDTFAETTKLLGALFPVLMFALALNVFLTYEQVPEMLVRWLNTIITDRASFLIVMNIFLLIIGCVMDIGSAILILSPILQPIAEAQGIDPVHFGIIMIVNLEIGYLTPPLGLNIIVAMSAFREEFWTICRAVLPFLVLMVIGLIVVTFWPDLSLYLVRR